MAWAGPTWGAEGKPLQATAAVGNALNHVPNFVGVEKGIFLKHGVDLKLKVLHLGQHLSQAVQAGEAQFAGAAFSNFPIAVERGFPAKSFVGVLGDRTQRYDDEPLSLIAHRETGIKQVKDLVGRKVGVQTGGTGHEYLGLLLRAEGIPDGRVTVLNVLNANMPAALGGRQIDAVVPVEPYGVLVLEKVGEASLVKRGGGLLGYYVNMAASNEVLEKNPELVYRYTVALAEACQYARQHPDEAAEIATRWVQGLDAAVAKKAIRYLHFDPRVTKQTMASWDENVRTLVEQKKMRQVLPWDRGNELRFIQRVEKEHPQLFGDLKPVP
jgi:ABC-type nitrate/sulfonate/bicarbonate transport system substrate-binding protein